MKHLIISLSCFLFLAYNAYCETDINPHFHNLTVRDGLPNDWIKSIVQDHQGFMWFATNDGLCKYDGKNFKTYRNEQRNSNSLSSNTVNCLLIDDAGNVWIGTNKGLDYYDVLLDKIIRTKTPTYNITSIMQYDVDDFIVSSHNGIITYKKSEDNAELYVLSDATNPNVSYPFRKMIAYNNDILVFANGGCYRFDTNHKSFHILFKDDEIFKGENIRAVHIHNNVLWMGILDDGLLYVNLDKIDTPKPFLNKYTKGQAIFSLTTNHENELIIGCENNGLVYINLESENPLSSVRSVQNPYNNPFGLVNNSVHALFEDNQNNLWIGTYNGISCQYNDGKGFSSLVNNANNTKSLSNNLVSSILEVGSDLWIGTENGIDIFNAKMEKIKTLNTKTKDGNQLLSEAILALAIGDDENVWAGSWSGGIDILNTEGEIIKQITRGENDQSIMHNSIMNIKKDNYGNMWVGTNGGGVNVYLKDEQKFIRYNRNDNDPNNLSNDYVLSFLITSDNEIWISTHDGLNLFNPIKQNFHCFRYNETDSTSIAGNTIDCMLEDKEGELWFGSTSGLSRFNRADSTFVSYYEEEGLPNNYIKSLMCDDNNQLWIGTNAGLSKLSFDKGYKNPQFVNYNVEDGLVGNVFIRRANLRKANGDFCFGTKDGLIYFNPVHIIDNEFIPDVYFSSIQINNRELKVNDETAILNKNICFNPDMKLKYDQSDISISFAALNYVVPGKNQYRYKMHGFDDDWVELGNERKATYTNIPYGKYVFQVLASNNSNVWNEKGAKLNIYITPPWYRTKLAYLLYFIVVMLLILSYRFFIVKQTMLETKLELEIVEKENLNRVNQMKTKFFTNISHEFLTPLSLILSPLESISADAELANDKLKNKISPIYRNAKRLQRLINQLLDISKINADHLALKVSQGNIHNFIYDISIGFKNLANQKNIVLDFKSTIEKEQVYFDADKIEKIIYNLLSNALKFTPENGKISLSLGFEGNYLNLKVEDTGIGIDAEEKELVFDSFYQSKHAKDSNYLGTGVGLNLVRGLVNVYGGTIDLTSKVNLGSCFTINIPYKKTNFAESAIEQQSNELEPRIDIDDEVQIETSAINETEYDKTLASILLVEDNIELNGHIVEMLSVKYNVTSAFDGQQGVNLAKNTIPDLIIADWVMPKMSGIDLLKTLRENESTSHIPIIILTAKIDDESKIISIENGADSFIAKPFDKQHLESTISNLLKSREHLKQVFKKNIVIEPTQVKITSVDEKFIKKSIKIIEENFMNQDFSVDFLAKEICMSRTQLHRKIRGLLGMPTSGFIRDIKIKKAADLLTIGQLRVSEAMYEVNIKSRNYFTKCFKEKYGMQPTEYVKQYKMQKEAD